MEIQIGTVKAASFWIVYDEPNPIVIGILSLFWLVLWLYGLRRINPRRPSPI